MKQPVEQAIADLQRQIDALRREVRELRERERNRFGALRLKDGITAPAAETGWGIVYIDAADGDLKIVFADSTIKVISADT